MDDVAGVAGDQDSGQDLDQLMSFLDLFLCPVELELSLEHLEGGWLLIFWVAFFGLKYIAVGVTPRGEVDQVIHRLVKSFIQQGIIIR